MSDLPDDTDAILNDARYFREWRKKGLRVECPVCGNWIVEEEKEDELDN